MADSASLLPAGVPVATDLLPVLLATSLAGTMLLRPVYGAEAELTDFTWVYLNAAAQRMLRLPPCPEASFLTLYPAAVRVGVFDFYREAFQTGELRHRQNPYLYDGLDGYYSLAAQRHEQLLLVSFTDANEQPRSALEVTLRESQAQAQAARAEAEAERQQLRQLNQELEARVQQRTRELAAQQQQLADILRQVPASIATLSGPDHRLGFFNEAYQQLAAGRARLGRPVATVFPEAAAPGQLARLDQVVASGEAATATEVALLSAQPDGSFQPQYVNFVYQPLRDHRSNLDSMLVFGVDVSEQVRARRQRETQQAELQRLFELAPVAITILRGPDLIIELANEAMGQLWGRPAADTRGRPHAEVLPELVGQGFQELLLQVLTTGESLTITEAPLLLARALAGPPSRVYVTCSFQFLPAAPDQLPGVLVVGTDVTEQVRARREVIEQRELLQAVVEQAPVALCLLRGPELVIELANPGMAAIWGRSPASLLGRPFLEALPAFAAQGYADKLARVLATGEPYVEQEGSFTLPLVDGQPAGRYYTCRYQPLHDAYGLTNSLLCLAVDVTEQVRARQQVHSRNEELRQSNTQLTRTNADLDTFVYTASHDLRGPIANLEGLLAALRVELVAQEDSGPTVPHLLSLMDHAVGRFQQTIGHLADIARLQQEAGTTAALVALAPILTDVQLDLAAVFAQAGATVTVALAPDYALPLAPKNLRSVVYNLLSNAVKYGHPDRPPRVRVEGERHAGRVVLRVHDNGLGLSAPQQQQLFGLFQRLHTHVEGTGVGLFTVKRIVENAGGTIAVQSQEGIGTTFTVELPLASATP